MNLFSYDGLLDRTVRAIGRYFLLNVIYVICCLPVVTIGAATTALYTVMLPSTNQTGPFRKFFAAFRSNFSQSTKIWLIFLLPLVLLCISIYLCLVYHFPGSNVMLILACICLALYMMIVSFVFPLQARYDNPPKTTIRNAFVLGIRTLIPGLLMGIISLLPLILFLVDLQLFIIVFPFWQFLGFSLTAKINSKICMFVFSALDPPADDPDRNNDPDD